jgi:hypothetical protein
MEAFCEIAGKLSPLHFGIGTDPDLSKMPTNKKVYLQFFCLLFCEGTFTSVF